MEPWQKLLQALCEIWIEEDIKLGKILINDSLEEEKFEPDELQQRNL